MTKKYIDKYFFEEYNVVIDEQEREVKT